MHIKLFLSSQIKLAHDSLHTVMYHMDTGILEKKLYNIHNTYIHINHREKKTLIVDLSSFLHVLLCKYTIRRIPLIEHC
jgi:hypothetical protein